MLNYLTDKENIIKRRDVRGALTELFLSYI